MVTLAFGAIAASYETFAAVTAPVAGVYAAPQPLAMACPAGSVKASCRRRPSPYRCW